MFCPNCGKANSAEQKFCRSCGLSLEKVVQSLVEQLPAAELDRALQDRRRRVDRLLTIFAGSAISILVLGILWGIIYEIIIVKGEVLTGLMFLAFIVGIILSALLVIYRDSLIKSGNRSTLQTKLPQVTLPRAGDTAKLLAEPQLEIVPGITDRTTELLAVENKDRAKQT